MNIQTTQDSASDLAEKRHNSNVVSGIHTVKKSFPKPTRLFSDIELVVLKQLYPSKSSSEYQFFLSQFKEGNEEAIVYLEQAVEEYRNKLESIRLIEVEQQKKLQEVLDAQEESRKKESAKQRRKEQRLQKKQEEAKTQRLQEVEARKIKASEDLMQCLEANKGIAVGLKEVLRLIRVVNGFNQDGKYHRHLIQQLKVNNEFSEETQQLSNLINNILRSGFTV